MPIREELRTFWWFRDQRIGGMAQPGFNQLAREAALDLSNEDRLVLNWISRAPTGRIPVSDLDAYLTWWRDIVVPFLDLPLDEFERSRSTLLDRSGLLNALDRVNHKTGILSDARWSDGDDHLEIRLDDRRIRHEIDTLERHGISVLAAMTEGGPHPVVHDSALDVHHFPVDDTRPPAREQVEAFASVLDQVYTRDQRMVVHCMAGIGRTTTILLAGHLLRGERLASMKKELETTNPRFLAKGSQWTFIEALAEELGLG